MKKILCLLFAMLLLLSLASTTLAAPAAEPAAIILERAVKASGGAKSYEAKMSMQLGIKADNENFDMSLLCDMRYFASPMKLHLKMNLEIPDNAPTAVQMYILQSGKSIKLYVHDGASWSKTQSDDDMADYMDQFVNIDELVNPSFAVYAKMYKNLEVEMDTYQGKPVYKLTAWLDPMAALELLSGMDDADIVDLLDVSAQYSFQIPMTMIIEAETYHLRYAALDMAKPLQKMLDSDASSDGVSIDQCLIKITYFNYNNARKIVLPAAARRAKTM